MKPVYEDRYYARKDDPLAIVRVWNVDGATVDADHVHGNADGGEWPRRAFRRVYTLITPVPPYDPARYWTGEVCECCLFAMLYAEPCQCPDDSDSHPAGLMGKLEGKHVTHGLLANHHDSRCPVNIYGSAGIEFPADSFECDCERSDFSRFQCDGCGAYLAGKREAITGWID